MYVCIGTSPLRDCEHERALYVQSGQLNQVLTPLCSTEGHHDMRTLGSVCVAPRILTWATRLRWVVTFVPWPPQPRRTGTRSPLNKSLVGPRGVLNAAVLISLLEIRGFLVVCMDYDTVHPVVSTYVSEEHDYVVCQQIRCEAEAAILIRSIGTLNCFTFVTRGSGYILV